MRNDVLIGCSYDQLIYHTPVLNISSLGSTIYIKIPESYCKYTLCDIYDISNKEPREVDFFGKLQRDFDHPWIQLPVAIFNLRSGKHTYRFNFLDQITNTFETLFISYVSQDDDPETPYIYMSNRGNSTSSSNEWKDGTYVDTFYRNLREDTEQTYGYDPLLFGEYENITSYNYCSTCNLPNCNNCPYKEA